MALVSYITFAMRDYAGKPATVRVFVPATATLAEIQALSDAIATEINPITGGVIESASVQLSLTLPGGLRTTALDDMDIERGANFAFSAANTAYSHTVRIPAAHSDIVDGEDVVETQDVTDWETVMLAGTLDLDPSDAYANDLESVVRRRVTFHK
jgi:hypothetical protein